ncbi:hypothetical protein [Nocardioides jensenii]|uniref:hypothetical protein n=1 Tax=Nocardioides jensenii TaxID=1843 RepID=UPI0012FA9C3D|nr:hypothetical protein [Nocardioides jensenii]
MHKSRGRNGRRRNRPSKNSRTARVRAPSAQRDELEPYVAAIDAANEREAAGDAAGAIDIMVDTPCGPDGEFMWAPWRLDRLIQLHLFASVLPPWVYARWTVQQSGSQMTRSSLERTVRAVDLTVEARGESPRSTPMSLRTRIGDRDWIAHQLAVHDLGGLAEFLGRRPAVAERAGDLSSWSDAPMGGYRLAFETEHELRWTDLSSGSEVTTINLGAASSRMYDGHVIGRIVTCEGVRLFSTPPGGVREEVAEEVAARPEEWLEVIKRSGDAWTIGLLTPGQNAPIVTDMAEEVWRDALVGDDYLRHAEYDEDGREIEPLPDELDAMVVDLIMSLLGHDSEGWFVDPACVAAALLSPEVWPEFVCRLGPEHAAALVALGEILVGPAGEGCRLLGSTLRESA